ncbi:MAG TPA: AAA family ATPase, partial [Actinophytocola sp.]|uniref:AAA family ATPase n=1 Tax=Actinophytocola sp. TaxID=1872138 RepID=UPI002DDDBA44
MAPLRPFPMVGREHQVGEILALLRRPDMAAAFLVGPAGIGKSRLAAEVLARARKQGHRVASVSGTQTCAQVPFAAVARFLPERGNAPASRLELFRSAGAALAGPGSTGRTVVLVDDAHLLDEPSAALLHHLASTQRAFLIGTVRGGNRLGDALLALWRQDRAVWIEVPPLRDGEVDDLLQAALGGQVDLGAGHELHRLSAGNPLYLRELIRTGLESGRLRSADGVWRLHDGPAVTTSLEELLGDWLRGVDAEVRAAAEVVAFAEPMGMRTLRRIVPAEALERAATAGLVCLAEDGRRREVRLSHPLIGELLRAASPPLRAAKINERLVGALAGTGLRRRGDALRLGMWQLTAGIPDDPALLLAAAAEAEAVFDHHLTLRLARAARDAGAGAAALRLEATATAWLGRTAAAEPLFAELERLAAGEDERASAALLRAGNLWLGHGQARRALRVVSAAEAAVRTPDAMAMLAAVRAFLLCQTGHTAEGLAVCAEALPLATEPAAVAHVLPVRAFALADAGRTGEALAAIAAAENVAGTERFPYLADGMELAHATALEHAGRLTEAAELTAERYRRALDGHSDQARTAWACFRGRIALRTGLVASAIRWLREGIALHRTAITLSGPVGRLDAVGALAHAQVLAGDLTAARATLTSTGAIDRDADIQAASLELAHAWLLAADGDLRAAHDRLEATAERARRLGRLAVCLRALHDLARLGAPDRASEPLAGLAGRLDGLWPDLYLAHTIALRRRDPAGLEECSARFAAAGALLE